MEKITLNYLSFELESMALSCNCCCRHRVVTCPVAYFANVQRIAGLSAYYV